MRDSFSMCYCNATVYRRARAASHWRQLKMCLGRVKYCLVNDKLNQALTTTQWVFSFYYLSYYQWLATQHEV